MAYKEIDIRIPVTISENELMNFISIKTGLKKFTYQILRKSLDARKKHNIFWQYRLGIISDEIKGEAIPEQKILVPEYKKRDKHVAIAGSGPAGIFSALFLIKSGFNVTIIERGSQVETRKSAIDHFEKTGVFDPNNNYAFGEGGAGTFSDGKLTSRTKSISGERNFIFEELIACGAPKEISYMTHPHLGTDNLYKITQNIRTKLLELGCNFMFENQVKDIIIRQNKLIACDSSSGIVEADYFIFATGHSAYETYRMLIRNEVAFQLKSFAIGFRAEHSQEIINKAQWGIAKLPGVKAAEYRLSAQTSDRTPVYSFCMCPGGKIVPATPYSHTNLVNGMSNYQRDSKWANAAIVAGVNLEKLLAKPVTASEALDWLEQLESSYYNHQGRNYSAPATTIKAFLKNKTSATLPKSSYPFELYEANFNELLPKNIIPALREGLESFCRRLKAYDSGIIMGLESKTSAPVQVVRHPEYLYSSYKNLFIAGEGSGWAGGIISSAADGLKVARQIALKRD